MQHAANSYSLSKSTTPIGNGRRRGGHCHGMGMGRGATLPMLLVLALTLTAGAGVKYDAILGSLRTDDAASGTWQPYDADLATWATVTPSANGKSLVSAADYAAMRTALSLVPGTHILPLTGGTLTGALSLNGAAPQITLGKDETAGTPNVPAVLKGWSAGDNAYYWSFTSATQTGNLTLTLPTALPGGAAYLLNSGATGTMGWTDPATFIADPASPEQGDILYYTGSAWARLAHGTAGQVLQSGGHGANPSWTAAGGGGGFPYARVELTYAEPLATDASAGGVFDCVLTGSPTLSNPTNATDGQPIKWRLKASGADRTVTLGNKFRIPNTSLFSSPFVITSGETSYLAVIYHATDDKFDIVSYVEGY